VMDQHASDAWYDSISATVIKNKVRGRNCLDLVTIGHSI